MGRQTRFRATSRKGKVHPRTDHEGSEGEYRYIPTLSLTSTLGGVGGQDHAPAALLPGETPSIPCIGGWVGLGPV